MNLLIYDEIIINSIKDKKCPLPLDKMVNLKSKKNILMSEIKLQENKKKL